MKIRHSASLTLCSVTNLLKTVIHDMICHFDYRVGSQNIMRQTRHILWQRITRRRQLLTNHHGQFLSVQVESQMSIKSRLSPAAVLKYIYKKRRRQRREKRGISGVYECIDCWMRWIGKCWTMGVIDKLNKVNKDKTMANNVGVGSSWLLQTLLNKLVLKLDSFFRCVKKSVPEGWCLMEIQ